MAAPLDTSRDFPPQSLRQYALLADGCRGALIGPRGDICWLCAPRWDSPATISHLVGGDGIYAVTPTATFVWGGYYENASLIWRSRWVTNTAFVECREALAYPADEHRVIVLRQLRGQDRDVELRIALRLSGNFSQKPMSRPQRDDDGRWSMRVGELYVRWSGAGEAHDEGGTLVWTMTLPAGARHDLVLEISDRALGGPVDPEVAWSGTQQAWHEAVPDLSAHASPPDATHAYAVLRGLTSPGGGMVAAATLGLPERAKAGKNYDYRYVWIRDQAYAGLACAVDQPYPLLDEALDFVTARLLEHGDKVSPAYRVDGGPVPKQTQADLPGYPGGSDTIGNWVRQQFQLDAQGETLQLLAAGARFDRLTTDHVEAIDVAIKVIEDKWKAPEAGIWELGDAWWTQSRLSVVAGLRAIARELPASGAARAGALADVVLAETSKRCLHPDGYWQRSPEHPGVDASLVLPAFRGALPADDPRTVATLAQVERDLVVDGYAYRYRPDARPLGEAEGAFALCGFLLCLAHLQQGHTTQAYRYFDQQRTACGPPGLLTEEYDVAQRQLRGNMPQAFVHAALLECSQRLPLLG